MWSYKRCRYCCMHGVTCPKTRDLRSQVKAVPTASHVLPRSANVYHGMPYSFIHNISSLEATCSHFKMYPKMRERIVSHKSDSVCTIPGLSLIRRNLNRSGFGNSLHAHNPVWAQVYPPKVECWRSSTMGVMLLPYRTCACNCWCFVTSFFAFILKSLPCDVLVADEMPHTP